MKYRFLLVAFIIAGLFYSACSTEPEIKEENVSRIIQTLSSDKMKGRHAFTPEINDAANFIAAEFQKIGLAPLNDENDFFQDFTIYSLTPSETKVTVNGQELNDQEFFGIIHEEEFELKESNSSIRYISADDSFRDAFRQFISNDDHNIIAVDKAHEKWFHRYRGYFNRANRSFELGDEPNDVFVLISAPIRSYDVSFKNKLESTELFNVAGMIEGQRKDEIVLFSAHYDHIGVITPMDEDSIANGANDNASGVSGVIELARHFSQQPTPERTIYFVNFTAEESGGFGSKYFSRYIDPENIVAMINIEMIGKPAIEGPDSGWITGFELSDLGEILQNSTHDSSYVFYPDPYPSQNLFYRSDNAPFARLGIPAHTISTTPIDMDQDYHGVTDEFKTLDISHATHTIQAIAKGTQVIISGEKTPTRINPDSLR